MKVSVAEARNRLTQLLQQVERGERVTICRHGTPVAELVPSSSETARKPEYGTLKGKVQHDPRMFDAMTDAEVSAFLEGRY